MRVLVACECSGRVKTAFRERGHDAWSCDIKPSEIPDDKFHIQGDATEVFNRGWDLMVAHPPCTDLCCSGAAWFAKKRADGSQYEAYKLFMSFANAKIARIAIENPIGVMSTQWRKPDQIIQPYFFGDPVKKTTCLWLKNLPPLFSTCIVEPEITTLKTGAKFSTWDYKISMNHKERAKLRSVTFPGIAKAMAEQWGGKESLK